MVFTVNEKRVLRFLAVGLKEHSINEVAKSCGLAPNGAFKILVKLEKEGVLTAAHIANIKAYRLDFGCEKTARVLELAFMPDALEGRIKARADDLKPLKSVAKACILFGSYITGKKQPGDLDVLFVLERRDFESYKKALAKVQDLVPVKIQDIVQTMDDLKENLQRDDVIVIEALRNGVVLWGFDALVKVVKNVSK